MCFKIGCAAGVPLAGLIAIIALSKIPRRVGCRRVAAGLALAIPTAAATLTLDPAGAMLWTETVRHTNISIVDDDVYTDLCDPGIRSQRSDVALEADEDSSINHVAWARERGG